MRPVSSLILALVVVAFAGTSWGAVNEVRALPLSFGEDELEISQRIVQGQSYELLTMRGCDLLRQAGQPCLPVKSMSFYIPRGRAVKHIRLEPTESMSLPGSYRIVPAQPELPLTEGFVQEYVPEDDEIYSSSEPFPASPVQYVSTGYMAGRAIASALVYPLQYVPATGEVILNTDLVLVVELMDAESEPPLPRETESVRELRNCMVRGLVSNGDDVDLDFAGGAPLDPSEATEYLIIAHPNHVDEYEPLKEWKTRKGIPTEIVTTDYAIDNYSGVDHAEKLRNCIIDYYLNSSTAWVLVTMAAPKAKIRGCYCSVGGTVDSGIPCDLYFADLDGNWNADGDTIWGEVSDNVDLYPDVYPGRIPTNTGIPCSVAVHKVLTYEGLFYVPSDYQLEMLFLAEYADAQTDGAIAKNLIDTESVPARFNPITKLYESSGNLNRTSAMNALNSGQGLINHDGHGNNSLISIGPSALDKEDAMSLTNGPRYSVLYTVACDPGNFGCVGGCFGRSFIKSPDGGGFFVGNSRYGWYWPGNPGYGTGELFDREFFKSMFTRGHVHLGIIHADAKAQRAPYSNSNNTSRWTQYACNLFGDPETPVWLDTPLTLAAAHDDEIEAGPQSFNVYVTNEGSPLSGARVCLWKGEEVYEVEETAGDGLVAFSISPSDSGEMMVTVTKNGYLPYTGTTWVSDPSSGLETGGMKPLSLKVTPNPATGSVRVIYALPGTASMAGEGTIDIYDALGRHVKSIPVENTTTSYSSLTWDGRSARGSRVPAGIYFLKISDGNDTISTKFVFLR